MRRASGVIVTIIAVMVGLYIDRPMLSDVVYQRGQMEINYGRPLVGLPFIWRALAIDPGDVKAARRIVWVDRELGRHTQAIADADRFLRDHPNDIGLQRERARTLFVSHQYQQAAKAFAQILHSKESVVNDGLYAWVAYLNLGEPAQARAVARFAYADHPESRSLRQAAQL